MVATVIAGVGAAAAAAGAANGIMQSGAASKNAAANNRLALLNYITQKRVADNQIEMGQAGNVDGRGNITTYDPVTRQWITNNTPQTRARLNAADNEELLRNTVDAQRGRIIRGNNFTRQLGEGNLADAALANRSLGSETPDQVRGALISRGVTAAMAGNNDLRSGAGLQLLRSGSGGEALLGTLGRRGLIDTRAAIAEAEANAGPEYVQRANARRSAANNEYNMFASRASQSQDAPFAVPGIDTAQDASRDRARAANAGSAANYNRIAAPTLASTENRLPVALAGLGANIDSLSRNGFIQSLINRFGSATDIPQESRQDYRNLGGNAVYPRETAADAGGAWD